VGLYVLLIRGLSPLDAPFDLGWGLVAAAYATAEVLVVHLQFRRDMHSFSLSEIPLVVGLFFLPPTMLLVALIVGSAAALALHRRQPPIKLAFNIANLAFTTGLAIVLFRLVLRSDDPLGPSGWAAAFAGAIAADLVGLLMITVAISLSTGRPPDITDLLGSGSIATFFNTCLGLLTATLLWIRPEAVWLPIVLAGLILGAYRVYGSVRQKHESLEILYASTRRLQEPSDIDRLVETLLAQARELFRAGHAEILLFPNENEPGFQATLGADVPIETVAVASVDPTRGVWARVASEGRGVCLPRPISGDRLREHFEARGIRDAMVAPLFGQDAVVGTMLVANRESIVATFGPDDLKLFETFTNHASASLENGRLIERLRSSAEATRHQALHDALTGLPNRSFFHQEVKDAIVSRDSTRRWMAVLLMDLDRFKEVNDTLGHHHGDLLLQAVADRLRSTVGPDDVVARLGGDEFGILLAAAPNRVTAQAFAERLIHVLAAPFLVQELALEVGASIGVALYPEHGRDVDTLLQRADVAMYQAKSNLRGHVVYSPDHDSYSPDRLLLLGELRGAIDDRQLTVVYQPKVDLATGRVIGGEALVRWPHPRRGLLCPDQFIPAAEHTGLLRPLTLYVLDAALAECVRWREENAELTVSVNLSVRNLLDVELPREIQDLLRRYSLPPSALVVEITESALIADPVRTHGTLQAIHELGVGISIDDFGTGYSSLSYLRRMPVDELKIDKSFVTTMADDDNDALIVRSTIELGRNLGLRVVAEGVETRQVWERLTALGCHVGQGYLFGRPVSADAFSVQLVPDVDGPIPVLEADIPLLRMRGRRVRILRPTGS
jgi:diguanylate cyclase (GGDEF)-like protein